MPSLDAVPLKRYALTMAYFGGCAADILLCDCIDYGRVQNQSRICPIKVGSFHIGKQISGYDGKRWSVAPWLMIQ